MDRQKYIEALEAYCEETNGCGNCKIGSSLYWSYCRANNFSNMADADLQIYARIAEIEFIDEVEAKRKLLKSWCTSVPCADCMLCNEAWDHVFKFENKNCLAFDEATEPELDKAIEIINRAVKGDVESSEEDPVNRPSHYTRGGIECIDAIESSMEPDEWAGFLKGQIVKYVWRYRLKGKPVEDLKKARYYLDKLIQAEEKKEATL